MKNLFLAEINEDATQHPIPTIDPLSELDILQLPNTVQRYFRNCGYVGRDKIYKARIVWEDVYMKLDKTKSWTKLHCYQYNSVAEPTRIVYMKSKIAGLFSFEGRDKFQHGKGNMLIKLLKLFTIANVKGKEMDESALVTVLAETLFVPGYALQDYVTWEAINDSTANATLAFNDLKVSGIFHFNDLGEMISFDTGDRYFGQKAGGFSKVRWSALVGDYLEKNGIKHPSKVKTVWHFDDGDFEYFKGRINSIEFNLKGVDRLIPSRKDSKSYY